MGFIVSTTEVHVGPIQSDRTLRGSILGGSTTDTARTATSMATPYIDDGHDELVVLDLDLDFSICLDITVVE